MKKNSIKTKLVGYTVLLVFLTVVAVNIVFAIVSYNHAQNTAERVYGNLAHDIAESVDKNIEDVHKNLSAFSQIASIANPETSVDERVAVSRAVQETLGEFVSLKMTDLSGNELVLSGEDQIDLSNRAYVQASLNGQTFVTSPFYSPIVGRMVVVISQPLRWNNEIVGVIFMLLPGDFLSDAIAAVKAGYDGYAFAIDSTGAMISHRDIIEILERDEHRYIEMAKTDESYEGLAEAVNTMLARKDGALRFTSAENESMLGGFSSTAQGWTVIVCSTIADVRTDANSAISTAIIVSAAFMLLAAIFLFVFAGTISKPLGYMSRAFELIGSKGDLNMPPDIMQSAQTCALRKDEIGLAARSFGSFLGRLVDIGQILEKASDGDLSTDVDLLSDSDVIGISLKRMLDNLNHLFGNIQASSTQVTAGSKQISDGAQSLAQGATEQAASIEELSSSIVTISDMAKENSANATASLNEVQEAGQLMSVSMAQMDNMLAAMKTIDSKSKDILKTTKVIDDIAFQTNILALNAAVEAARAGQHGKGFAVVAEEVRNLASKSAEAAKETAALLESSSQSVEQGNSIVGKVSESLNAAAEIAQSNAAKIAIVQQTSAQQNEAMAQVNVGIDQVAQVVQQNSATAEQSAASSEEMSSQATLLQELISQFRLKTENMAYGSLPEAGTTTPKRLAMPQADRPLMADDKSGDFGKY